MKRDDAGVTLAELLVTMALLVVVMTVLFGGVLSVHRTHRDVTTETWNREDAMLATNWLSRDLRDALAVTRGATPSTVTVWLDRDDNGLQSAEEVVTWSTGTTANGRPALLRRTAAGALQMLPSVTALQLAYAPAAPAAVRTVTATVRYARANGSERSDTWTVRNRNTA